jgi:flagellar basal-body rod protein FlgB
MFIDRLVNQTNAPLVERVLKFAAARHRLIAENMANVDTPGYRQKDLSAAKFYALINDKVRQKKESAPGTTTFDDIDLNADHPSANILFHDRNNRSMEQLAAEQAKNGMLYMTAIELLKKQYGAMEMALKERIA